MSPTFDVTMPRLLISGERETEQAERRSQVRVVRLDYGGRRRGERARSIGCGLEDRPVEDVVAESRPIADARDAPRSSRCSYTKRDTCCVNTRGALSRIVAASIWSSP